MIDKFQKPEKHASMLANSMLLIVMPGNASNLKTCFYAIQVWLCLHIVVMILSIDFSQEMLAIDMLTA